MDALDAGSGRAGVAARRRLRAGQPHDQRRALAHEARRHDRRQGWVSTQIYEGSIFHTSSNNFWGHMAVPVLFLYTFLHKSLRNAFNSSLKMEEAKDIHTSLRKASGIMKFVQDTLLPQVM